MLLPLRVQPLKDEILSSWLVRLAMRNSYGLHTFYRKVLKIDRPLWNRDIDKYCHPEIIQDLSVSSGISYRAIENLTLGSYIGEIFQEVNISGLSRWIIPLGIYHRTRTLPSIQYCPRCLSQSFFKKQWRLSLNTYCSIHNELFWQTCYSCKKPVSFHRNGIGSDNSDFIPKLKITQCWSCKAHLDRAPVKPLPQQHPFAGHLNNIANLFDLNENLTGNPVHPLSYFHGLWITCNVLLNKKAHRLREAIEYKYQIKLTSLDIQKKKTFDCLSVEHRFNTLATVLFLLKDNANELITLMNRCDLHSSIFSEYKGLIPFWLDEIIFTNLHISMHRPGKQEILACIDYLKSNKMNYSKKNICKTMGISQDYLSKYY